MGQVNKKSQVKNTNRDTQVRSLKEVSKNNATDKVLDLSNEYEVKSYKIIFNFVSRVLDGYFLFRMRKASVHAGSSTYFAVMGIFPMLLLMISLVGLIMGDLDQAKQQVLLNFKQNFPQLAPWIFKSIQTIVNKQLHSGIGNKAFNCIFLLWASIGFYNSVIVAIKDITHVENKGGVLFDDIRALFGCVFVSCFFILILGFSKNAFIYNYFSAQSGVVKDILLFLANVGFFQISLSMLFFTLCFKIMEKVSWKDSFFGALTFVCCFIFAKATYGIYINTIGTELKLSFGNFYTLVIALIWIYFLMCSFFLGACVAFTSKSSIIPRDVLMNMPEDIKK
jgi:membrane protein